MGTQKLDMTEPLENNKSKNNVSLRVPFSVNVSFLDEFIRNSIEEESKS